MTDIESEYIIFAYQMAILDAKKQNVRFREHLRKIIECADQGRFHQSNTAFNDIVFIAENALSERDANNA